MRIKGCEQWVQIPLPCSLVIILSLLPRLLIPPALSYGSYNYYCKHGNNHTGPEAREVTYGDAGADRYAEQAGYANGNRLASC